MTRTTPALRRSLLACLSLAVAASTLLLAGCGSVDQPQYLAESPVGSDTWSPVAAKPAWVTAPPARDGWVRYVVQGRSNLRSIATHNGGPPADRQAQRDIEAQLVPVVGAEKTGQVVATLPTALRLVDRACCEEILTRDPVPGNTLCTAWALWEAPLDELLAPLPEADRATARAALVQ